MEILITAGQQMAGKRGRKRRENCVVEGQREWEGVDIVAPGGEVGGEWIRRLAAPNL